MHLKIACNFKKILISIYVLLFTTQIEAQLSQAYVGTASENEVANDVKRLSNGNSIIVGFRSTSTSANRDYFITLISSRNTVLWAKGAGGTQRDELHRVIETKNGDFVAVGYCNENKPYSNEANSTKECLIVRYSPTGALLWRKQYRVSNSTSAGDRFRAVCEMPNGNLVVAGIYDERGNTSEGLVGYLDSDGNPTNVGFRRINQSAVSDALSGITALGNDIIITGVRSTNSQYNGTIIRMDSYGDIVFAKQYNYSSSINNNHYNWFSDVQVKDAKIFVNAFNMNAWTDITSNITGMLVTSLDGKDAKITETDNLNSLKYVNASAVFPLNSKDILMLQNPSNISYSGYSGLPKHQGVLSRINTNNNSITYSKSVSRLGSQSMHSLDYKDGFLTIVGSGINDPLNYSSEKYDIFLMHTDLSFSLNPENGIVCELKDESITIANNPVTDSDIKDIITNTPASAAANNNLTDVVLPFNVIHICGDIPTSTTKYEYHFYANSLVSNYPNPFTQSTLIKYSLPPNTNDASIIITSNTGIIVDTIKLVSMEEGEFRYFAENLEGGVYNLTLIANGQKIETKKMLIAR